MNFAKPSKKIYDLNDLKNFQNSIAFQKLSKVLNEILIAVQDKKVPNDILNPDIVTRKQLPNMVIPSLIDENKESFECSENGKVLIETIDKLNQLIDETPPIEGPTRFGNLACRLWHDKVETILEKELKKFKVEGVNLDDFLIESSYYIASSFGSKIRLDYGTGHELSYLTFIGSLLDYKVIPLDGYELLVLFSKYYDLIRKLIIVYNLEPAGSHGVWGLDDHFHLIYIIGSSQFCNDKLAPVVSRALSNQTINTYKLTNLYINSIAFIFKIKTGPFNEHSPIIYDIHQNVYSWQKVRQGLIKMYFDEVFKKYPVIQHFWFGNVLYPWKDVHGKDLPVYQKEMKEEEEQPSSKTTTKMPMPMTRAPWARR
ncbi:unnamed protein product [Candida verbasci]|uniref:Serine/threonine-protein phosphatase 2A activator n=1 Tax=Candida verbasci TaxID=1227364 RepID=A0A9W4TRI0_9ASCO|nr:unnamed protein product [Candida verbasci]